jgi:hypothetical protein
MGGLVEGGASRGHASGSEHHAHGCPGTGRSRSPT